jgi:outer membrane scaffolding protein for murein synthesis (MipA/OmpV family)
MNAGHGRGWPWLAGGALLLVCRGAVAQTEAVAEPAPADGEPPRRWAVAVGAVGNVGPEFAGSSQVGFKLQPGLALRWGRFSLASRSAFAVRGEGGAAQGGLRMELVRSGRWRSSLGLRWDSGRDEDSSAQLEGLGDVRGTLRARLALGYSFDHGWRTGVSLTSDLLGRGGGWQGEWSAGRDLLLTPSTTAGAGLTLGYGGRRWQQTYYGISPEQATRTRHPVYTPGGGLRDVTLSLGGRTELGQGWALFYGTGVSRLVDVSAASPLVRERKGWGLSAGVVKRLGGG